MEVLSRIVDRSIGRIVAEADEPAEMGTICNSVPIEFFLYSPVLTKFMFFKWGYYYVGTEEFNRYSEWKLPEMLSDLLDRVKSIFLLHKTYYIWDESLIWVLCREITRFYKMQIITPEEKDEICLALKDMMVKLEQTLNRSYMPTVGVAREAAFYVSSIPMGFMCNYIQAGSRHSLTFQAGFSVCTIDNSPGDFRRLREWVDSFRDVSTLLSRSGRIERRLFFESQYKIIDDLLKSELPAY